MQATPIALAALAVITCCRPSLAITAEPSGTLLLQQPDVGDREVAFIYDDDVWVADSDGGTARRLTSAAGTEAAPHISPDGSMVAFSGNYDGNVDVYLVPVTGGVPKRLTWHGGPDIVQGFLPDGSVLFSSYRYLHTDRVMQLFAVTPAGTMPERLPVPDGDDAQVAPDGSRVAFTTMPPAYKNAVPQTKNYRGGDSARIWIMDLADVRAPHNLYKYFQNTAGRSIALEIGPRPDGRGARTITTIPIHDDMMLRRMDWIEANIRKVDTASQGRVAYVHVPDTASRGLAMFKRYFYPQSHKEAIGLGTIVGTATTGALVGNLGVPTLMDGSVVTAPNYAFWTEEDGWAVENEGVPPDIEVQQLPAAINAGKDPQLEAAIETVLRALPPARSRPAHPPYPVRTSP